MATNTPSDKSLDNAIICFEKGEFREAFSHYVEALKTDPEKRDENSELFCVSLSKLSDKLIREGHLGDLFRFQEQAFEIYPYFPPLLNQMGNQLFRLGYLDESASLFRRCLQLDPNNGNAVEGMDNLRGALVERWHFRMLNDRKRNEAYRSAITKAVFNGRDRVLDIGTGSGILAMFAAEAGASDVVAVEMSKTMYEIANDVIGRSSLSEHITLLHKKCEDLDSLDLPRTLVVTETFDAGLLGEHVLSALAHTWRQLTAKTDVAVIPKSAAAYLCAIESDTIRQSNRFLYPGLPEVDFNRVFIRSDVGAHSNCSEPYTTENLNSIRGGYKKLSDVTKVNSFTFDDPKGDYSFSARWPVALTITKAGRVDALASWFTLQLDEEITVGSAPEDNSCWEQVIHPVCGHSWTEQNSATYAKVTPGDILNILGAYEDNALTFTLNSVTRKDSEPTRSSSAPFSLNQPENHTYYVTRTEVLTLNDLDYNHVLLRCVSRHLAEAKPRSVLLLTEYAPLVAVQLLKNHVSHVTVSGMTSSQHGALVKAVLNENKLDEDKVDFVGKELDELDQEYDVMIVDVVEVGGQLCQQVLEDVALAKESCLIAKPLIIPAKVKVIGLAVQSDELAATSYIINDSNTLGYAIGSFLNDFRMRSYVDIDLLTLAHRKLSMPFDLLEMDLQAPHTTGSIPPYLNQVKCRTVEMVESGTITAVIYWFELHLDGNTAICTLDPRYHWRQAAVMMDNTPAVERGDKVTVTAYCNHSCVQVNIS